MLLLICRRDQWASMVPNEELTDSLCYMDPRLLTLASPYCSFSQPVFVPSNNFTQHHFANDFARNETQWTTNDDYDEFTVVIYHCSKNAAEHVSGVFQLEILTQSPFGLSYLSADSNALPVVYLVVFGLWITIALYWAQNFIRNHKQIVWKNLVIYKLLTAIIVSNLLFSMVAFCLWLEISSNYYFSFFTVFLYDLLCILSFALMYAMLLLLSKGYGIIRTHLVPGEWRAAILILFFLTLTENLEMVSSFSSLFGLCVFYVVFYEHVLRNSTNTLIHTAEYHGRLSRFIKEEREAENNNQIEVQSITSQISGPIPNSTDFDYCRLTDTSSENVHIINEEPHQRPIFGPASDHEPLALQTIDISEQDEIVLDDTMQGEASAQTLVNQVMQASKVFSNASSDNTRDLRTIRKVVNPDSDLMQAYDRKLAIMKMSWLLIIAYACANIGIQCFRFLSSNSSISFLTLILRHFLDLIGVFFLALIFRLSKQKAGAVKL